MKIKDNIVYLINVKLVNFNQINSYISKYNFIKKLDKNNNFLDENSRKLHLASLFFIINYLQTNNIPIKNLIFDNMHYSINDNRHYFSIAHKDNYVVFIANNNPIGIDIEKINKNLNVDIVKKYFDNYLSNLNNEKFLLCWTKAESLLKCSGFSFNESCKLINNNDSNNIKNIYFFKTTKYKNMIITTCYKENLNREYKICELDYLPK